MAETPRVFISMDCAEPAPLAAFWAAMLNGEVAFSTPDVVGVRTEGMWLTALRTSDHRPPTWPGDEIPKQMHLDLGVTNLDEAVADAERHGARQATTQPAPDRWRVLFDPAGHPFCLTTQIPPEAR